LILISDFINSLSDVQIRNLWKWNYVRELWLISTKDYDPDEANALWLAMLKVNEVFNQFRCRFIGKASLVHLFWGAFDLAVTRFSGNPAPLHQGGMPEKAYFSQEMGESILNSEDVGNSESPENKLFDF
jgi:hypothetical protein